MGGLQLFVRMQENFGLKYPSEVGLVDKAKIGGCKLLICKNPKNKSVIRMGIC